MNKRVVSFFKGVAFAAASMALSRVLPSRTHRSRSGRGRSRGRVTEKSGVTPRCSMAAALAESTASAVSFSQK